MKMSQVLQSMSDSSLIDWWKQYGRPKQATYYPNAAKSRRIALNEMRKRGLKLNEVQSFYRPMGYLDCGPDLSHKSGGLFWWGLGGPESRKIIPRLP